MRKIVLVLSMITMVVSLLANPSLQKERRINPDNLPEQAKEFVKDHFDSSVTILTVEKGWNKYEVRLSNGFEIDFDKRGVWRNLEANTGIVPQSMISLLPEEITSHIRNNYRGWNVTDINKKDYGYDIEIFDPATGNDIELEFSHEGNLLKVDD